MGTIKELSRETVRDNRLIVLVGTLGYASVTALISGIFQVINLWWIGIIPMTLCVYAYLYKIHELSLKMVKHQEITITMFFEKPFGSKKTTIVFLGYIIWALITAATLFLITIVPKMGILLLILIFCMLVFGNEVSNFVMLQDNLDEGILKSYKQAINSVLTNRSLFGHNMLRSFTAMVQGVILVVCTNVFVYGPQIQKALQLDVSTSESTIRMIFSSPLSSFVQTVGIQVVILYILFISTIVTTTYAKQKQIIKLH